MQCKICCIQNIAEANLAIRYGASAIGLVGWMPSGPGPISDDEIADIASRCTGKIETFLLTSETNPQKIIAHHQATQTSSIQLVDYVKIQDLAEVKQALPHIKLVQVLHVLSLTDVDLAQRLSPVVDMLLLDSGNPSLQTKELGGTGRIHDWNISAEIVKNIEKPIFLAGGLDAQNVELAIQKVGPAGVDLCSGVRTDGKLDERKLSAFMAALTIA